MERLLHFTNYFLTSDQIKLLSQFHYPIAIIIFFLTFVFITSERVHRTIIAMLGAVVMIGLGMLNFHDAYIKYIDWETIALLIGMMTIVSVSLESGIFNYLAIKAAKMSRGKPINLLLSFAIVTAIGSAFLDNVTTVLLMVPITLSVTKIIKVNPMPFFMAEIISSNIGGSATLIGDPPNIMIGSKNTHLSFSDFLINMGPIAIITGLISILVLLFIYRKQLTTSDVRIETIMHLDPKAYIKSRKGAKQSIIVLSLTITGFFLHSVIGVTGGYIALTGATILLLISKNSEQKLENTFAKIEWTTIFLLVGLFMQVGGLIEVGVIDTIGEQMYNLVGTDLNVASSVILWFSALISGFSGNLPAATVMIPVLQKYINTLAQHGVVSSIQNAETSVLWWSLGLGSCLGGVATLIGCPANIVVINMARKEGHKISYFDYLKVGLPMAILIVAISNVYIYIRYFM